MTFIALILAAKLQQPKKPCFQLMAECFKDLTGQRTSVSKLNELELKVLVTLGFDFNFVVEPVDLIKRYLGLLGHPASEAM